MRSPASIGLPADKFPSWRKGQDRAVRKLIYSQDRFNLLCTPTGSGKSATYMSVGAIDDGRMLVTTATRELQDRIGDEFESMGLVDMRGRQNYVCNIDERKTAAEAVCMVGVFCKLMREGGCDFYDQRTEAAAARLVVTNYKYRLHDEDSTALGSFDTLVLDEAHKAPDEIAEWAAVEIHESELRRFGLEWPRYVGTRRPEHWANMNLHIVEERAKTDENQETRKVARDLTRKLSRLCRLSDEDWIGSRPRRGVFRWDLVEPGKLAEDVLFRGAKKVILVSASVRRKTLQLLGVSDKVQIVEQESTFPVARRPVYYWPIARMGRKMGRYERQLVFRAMDKFAGDRLDRNGLIHSVSYDLAEEIRATSELSSHMLVHKRGQDGRDILDEFKWRGKRRPTILVSPAFSTGTDMPYRVAEYQIIPKMPFPNFGSPLVQARIKRDKTYVAYVTIQHLVQSVGRGMRAPDDQCESLILDGHFGWLRGSNWDFAPNSFHIAVKTISADAPSPRPLPRLERG